MNRRLIRSSLSNMKENVSGRSNIKEKVSGRSQNKRPSAPEQTNAESFYYLKQMKNKTSMVLITTDGEELRGNIEWYDRNSIKINRNSGGNLLIFKHSIRYMYKEDEEELTNN